MVITHSENKCIRGCVHIHIPSYRSPLLHNIQIGDKNKSLMIVCYDKGRRTEYMLIDDISISRSKMWRPMEMKVKNPALPLYANHLVEQKFLSEKERFMYKVLLSITFTWLFPLSIPNKSYCIISIALLKFFGKTPLFNSILSCASQCS